MAEPTTYIVLRQRAGDTWEDVANCTAASAEAAIRKAFSSNELEAGTYVAVPVRSFKPVTVKAETVVTLKIEEAG